MGNKNSYEEINEAQGKAINIHRLEEQEKIHPTTEGRRLINLHYYEHYFKYIKYDNTYNKWKGLINERVIGYYDTREEALNRVLDKIDSIFGEIENSPFPNPENKKPYRY
jgi:hypothetical protein